MPPRKRRPLDRAQLAPQIRRAGQSPMRTEAETLRAAAKELRDRPESFYIPGIALAEPLAAWLEATARSAVTVDSAVAAFAVARVILGESS